MKQPPADITKCLLDCSDQLQGTGFDVGVDEIAKLSGVPRATLYYYFSGKDDLIAFFLANKLDTVQTALVETAAIAGTPAERLARVLKALLTSMSEHPVICTDLPVALHRAGTYAEVAARMEQVVLAPLREVLIEGRATGDFTVAEPAIVSVSFVGALMQASLAQFTASGAIDADGLADELVPIMVSGLTRNATVAAG
ncbi:MAG TPA: TetR/AcrR family transcriptional regulator [Dehalococcoidia bacterium]|nr:TetR/AcrR family transcriptional regulator [Dehalococcoidia bacterium]